MTRYVTVSYESTGDDNVAVCATNLSVGNTYLISGAYVKYVFPEGGEKLFIEVVDPHYRDPVGPVGQDDW